MAEQTAKSGDSINERIAWLAAFEATAEADQRRQAGSESTWSWSRLGLFLAGAVVWIPLGGQPWIAGAISAAAAVAFVVAVRRHTAFRLAREQADRLLLMIAETRQRLGGQVALVRSWERPADEEEGAVRLEALLEDGATWELTDQERDDLDLFARPVGLFGLLNRTSTLLGARRLRDRIDRPMLSGERIVARQAIVARLADDPEMRLRLMAALAVLRKEDRRLGGWLKAVRDAQPLKLFVSPAGLAVWSWIGAAMILASIGAMVVGDARWGWAIGLVTLINLMIYVRCLGALVEAIQPWRDVAWGARGLLLAARQAAALLPEEGELARLRAVCAAATRPEVMPRQTGRLGWTDNGGMVGFLTNLVVLSDLHVARALVAPAVAHRAELLASASALADLETVLSLGAFAWEQPVTCWPRPQRDSGLRIESGRHPLVPADRVVANSVGLDATGRVWIITGSNMAGKSTLLRMTGTSVLLAQMGSAVAAESMSWSPLRLITDLRARDNLAANESYFLSEVRHLRRMILPPAGDAPILGLIDEPFRGTNSHDQTAASRAVLMHLFESRHLFLVATHDRYLTELADGSVARNFHFRENLSSEGMVFDYRLHDGPATTRNALYVLEREGYPATLLERAHAWHGDEQPAQ